MFSNFKLVWMNFNPFLLTIFFGIRVKALGNRSKRFCPVCSFHRTIQGVPDINIFFKPTTAIFTLIKCVVGWLQVRMRLAKETEKKTKWMIEQLQDEIINAVSLLFKHKSESINAEVPLLLPVFSFEKLCLIYQLLCSFSHLSLPFEHAYRNNCPYCLIHQPMNSHHEQCLLF